jgi:hypothetical protein
MRKIVLLLFLVLALTAVSTPALAFDDEHDDHGCATELGHCFESAAQIESFWYRWAAGIDCELDFIECARIKIFGS